jgi:hypothetical protein
MKTAHGKKRKTPSRGLTRYELAQRLGVGLTTIDKVIAMGKLGANGSNGRAKTYRLSAAREALFSHAPEVGVAADVLMRDYSTSVQDFDDRRHHLSELHISDAAWLPRWKACVAWLDKRMSAWPGRIAEVLGPLDAAGACYLDAAPPRNERPRRLVPPDELARILDGPPEGRPWPPAAASGLRRLVDRGEGVWLDDGGGWCGEKACMPPSPPVAPLGLIRPLLAELSLACATSPEWAALERTLALPPPATARPVPRDVDAARNAWRAARASYREERVRIRRNHHRRADVREAIAATVERSRWRWWRFRGQARQYVGKPFEARSAAETLKRETLAELASLGGLVPVGLPAPLAPHAAKTGASARRRVKARGRK